MSRDVGVDLHRRRSQVVILDEAGGLVSSRQVVNDPVVLGEAVAAAGAHRRVLARRAPQVIERVGRSGASRGSTMTERPRHLLRNVLGIKPNTVEARPSGHVPTLYRSGRSARLGVYRESSTVCRAAAWAKSGEKGCPCEIAAARAW